MYIILKVGKLKLAGATKDEYCIATDTLLCKKGFRLQAGNLLWNKGLFRYKDIIEGWVRVCH